jgi:predicted TIM-barrel fold metal-dependent hydrolase
MERKRGHLPIIFDSHTHLFSPAVIASVSSRRELADLLCLEVDKAPHRTDKQALKSDLQDAGIKGALLLPTAPANGVREVNDRFLSTIKGEESLWTAGTLHPLYPDIDGELERLHEQNVRALKFSSFSQAIDLDAKETFLLLERISFRNSVYGSKFFTIWDTFYRADVHFGTEERFITSPSKLACLVTGFPGIDFVGAHMGGLAAPFSEIEKYLFPQKNLYLETSNAAHVLSRSEFIELLKDHGAERILFGTDWPWFGQKQETGLIGDLMNDAGFSKHEQAKVFSGNISRLLNLKEK